MRSRAGFSLVETLAAAAVTGMILVVCLGFIKILSQNRVRAQRQKDAAAAAARLYAALRDDVLNAKRLLVDEDENFITLTCRLPGLDEKGVLLTDRTDEAVTVYSRRAKNVVRRREREDPSGPKSSEEVLAENVVDFSVDLAALPLSEDPYGAELGFSLPQGAEVKKFRGFVSRRNAP